MELKYDEIEREVRDLLLDMSERHMLEISEWKNSTEFITMYIMKKTETSLKKEEHK